jgi:hypothetical protein
MGDVLMKFWRCIAFLTVATVSTASGQGRAISSDQTEEQAGIKEPAMDFAVLLEMGEGRPTATCSPRSGRGLRLNTCDSCCCSRTQR